MKRTRYVIADQDMGIFLGTYNGEDFGDEDDNRVYICFASQNPFGLTNSCSFNTEAAAKFFINNAFPPSKRQGLKILPVESETDFPSAIDLIKSGYGEFTHDMIDGLFDEKSLQTIH